MLVKWAIEGRRKSAQLKPSRFEDDRQNSNSSSMEKASATGGSRITSSPERPETTAQALTAQLDRLHYESDAAFARTSENEGDRAMRRIHAEERDTKLRDDKLLSLTGPRLHGGDESQGPEKEATMPLTQENIEKLVHEQDGDSTQVRKSGKQDSSSSMLDQADVQSEKKTGIQSSRGSRPSPLGSRHHDSEQTITGTYFSK
jgi:hypothetical protein